MKRISKYYLFVLLFLIVPHMLIAQVRVQTDTLTITNSRILDRSNTIGASTEMVKMCNLTDKELNTKYRSLSTDAGFKVLQTQLLNNKFIKLNHQATSFGFTGTIKDATGKLLPVEFYAFDFYNKSTNQMASIIWRNDGKTIYKAYLLFPAGEKEFDMAMERSIEFYVDGNNKLIKATSFGRCWKKCVFKNCNTWCIGMIAICAGATATIAVASAGPTAGIGVGAAVAIFAGCAAISCAACFGICAAGCS